jgi:hypothetical protein
LPSIIKVDQIQSDTGTVNQTSNLSFTGTGQRITGDFSNSTIANRVGFQTSTTNGSTNLFSIPNGTGAQSGFFARNSSDANNNAWTGIYSNATESSLAAGISGTGSYLPLTMLTGGSERMRITTAGVVELPSGQLKFPASQNASADPNTLDDYEEGTWTPVDGSGAGLSFSNTSGNCFYTKVGRTVTVTFRLTYPSTASGSAAVVGGLPFLAIDTNVNVQAVCFGEQNFSAGAMGLVQDNNTTFLFLTTNGTSVTVHTNANVSGKDFRGTATYQAA